MSIRMLEAGDPRFDLLPSVAEQYPNGTPYERACRTEFILALVLACKVDRNDWKARAERAEFLLALALAAKMEPPAGFVEWAAERNADYADERAGINPKAHRYSQ